VGKAALAIISYRHPELVSGSIVQHAQGLKGKMDPEPSSG